MPVFVYKAADRRGQTIDGVMDAPDARAVVERLQKDAYYPIKITAHGERAPLFSLGGSRVGQRDLLALTQQLATLFEAGLPLDRALTILEELAPNARVKAIVSDLLRSVRGGASFSEALAKHHPRPFSRLYINMVRAGEKGGVLEVALRRLAGLDGHARGPAVVGPRDPERTDLRRHRAARGDGALRAHAGHDAALRGAGPRRARRRRRHDVQPGGGRRGVAPVGRRQARRDDRGGHAGSGHVPRPRHPHGARGRRDGTDGGDAAQGRRHVRDRRADRDEANARPARADNHSRDGGARGVHRRRHADGHFLDQRGGAVRRGRFVRGLRNERGFTLVELLVVIIVLGLLVGLVGPRLFGHVGTSRQAAAKAQIELFGTALDAYRLDVGSYPSGVQGLQALVANPNVPNWNGPYLKKKEVPLDPWDAPYKYACCPGQHDDYDLWSEGADKAPGGEGENADVTSWQALKSRKAQP